MIMDFEQIVLEYQDLIYTVCLNILKNPHDAENAAQETFLSAFISSKQNGGIDNVKAWLCRIAVNKSIDFKRKNSKAVHVELSESIAAEDKTAQKELREKLNEVISGIPEKYANAVKAFYFERMSVKEIAGHYKLPEKTVETRLYRAKKLMKEKWHEY